MPNYFDVRKGRDGAVSLVVPDVAESDVAQEIAVAPYRGGGVSLSAAVVVLHRRLAAVETLLQSLAPTAPPETCPAKPGPLRNCRRDRTPYGWRPDPHDDKRLVADPAEQFTLRLAKAEAARGRGLLDLCRWLDRRGRFRRNGKPWRSLPSTLRAILRRAT